MECGHKYLIMYEAPLYITRINGLVNVMFLKLQVAFLTQQGVKTCFITADQQDDGIKEGVVQGLYQLVYFMLEMLLGNKRWQKVLLNTSTLLVLPSLKWLKWLKYWMEELVSIQLSE